MYLRYSYVCDETHRELPKRDDKPFLVSGVSILQVPNQDREYKVSVLDGADIPVLFNVDHSRYVKVIQVVKLFGLCV